MVSLINTNSIIPSETTYGLNVTLTNPAISAPSPYPCNITLVVTEGNTSRTALPTDVSLGVSIIGKDLYGGYDQAPMIMLFKYQLPLTIIH